MAEWSTEFSGTLLEQVNAAISEVFWGDLRKGSRLRNLRFFVPITQRAVCYSRSPRSKTASITRRARF